MKIKSIIAAIAVCATAAPSFGDSLLTTQAAYSGPLVSDLKARFDVGDIITVVVRETFDASTTSGTQTKKEADTESEADADDNQFFIAQDPGLNILNEEELPNWKVEAENETRATGTTKRSSKLQLTITCMVVRIINDELLYIEGNKEMMVNLENTTVKVSGVIRARDVTAANAIASTQIANASIQVQGRGPLWNNQRRGIFTKILDWFSPF